MGSLNCNRQLVSRRQAIGDFMEKQKVDVMALQDTGVVQIGDENALYHYFKERGWILICKSWLPTTRHGEYNEDEIREMEQHFVKKGNHRPLIRARLAWLVKKEVMMRCEVMYTGTKRERLQCLVMHHRGGKVSFINVYMPLEADEQAVVHLQLQRLAAVCSAKQVILGDWNAVCNPRVDRRPSRTALSDLDSILLESVGVMGALDAFRALHPHSAAFSYNHNGAASRIDMAFVSEALVESAVGAAIAQLFHDDHEPIVLALELAKEVVSTEGSGPARVRFQLPKASKDTAGPKWREFTAALASSTAQLSPAQLASQNDIDCEAQALIDTLSDAARKVFGFRKSRPDKKPFRDKKTERLFQKEVHINRLTRKVRTICRMESPDAAHRFQALRNKIAKCIGHATPEHPWEVIPLLRRQRKQVKRALKKHQAEMRSKEIEEFYNQLEKQDGKPQGFRQFSPKISQNSAVHAVLRKDGSLATGAREVREAVREYTHNLLGVVQDLPVWDEAKDGQAPWAAYDEELPPLQEDYTISLRDIQRKLRKCNLNAAPDYYGQTFGMLFHAPTTYLERVAELMNTMITQEHVPEVFGATPMFFLHKKGSPLVLANKRTIALVEVHLKLCDGIMVERASELLEDSGRLSPLQWAGRPGRGCMQALGIVDQTADHATRNRQYQNCYFGMVDFFKAYDWVPHEPLFGRVKRIGLPVFARHLKAMYSKTRLVIMTAFGFTEAVSQKRGVFQGACSSPAVYVVFTNPMLRMIDSGRGYKVRAIDPNEPNLPQRRYPSVEVKGAAIVDDLLVVRRSHADMAEAVKNVCMFGYFNGQLVTPSKTVIVSNAHLAYDRRPFHVCTEWVAPPERTANATTAFAVGDWDTVFRYLGIYRSGGDRSTAHTSHTERLIFGFLSKLARKKAPGDFTTKVVNALMYSVVRFAAPFVHFKKSWIKRIQGTITRVAKKAQGLSSRTPNLLFYCEQATGLRSLEVEIHAAQLAAFSQLTGGYQEVIAVFEANDGDLALKGNGLPILYLHAQKYQWLKGSFLGAVKGLMEKYGWRAIWSDSSLGVAQGDARFYKWTSSATRPGGERRSDTVTVECHEVGAIAVHKGLFPHFVHTSVDNWMIDSPVLPRTVFDAWRNSLVNGTQNALRSRASTYLSWRATVCSNNGQVRPALLAPSREDSRDFWRQVSGGQVELRAHGLKWAVLGTTRFDDGAKRGPYHGGGVAVCMEVQRVLHIPTPQNQSVGHSLAMGVVAILSVCDCNQELIISTPLEYLGRHVMEWPHWLPGKRARHPLRSTIERIVDLVRWRRNVTEFVVTPTAGLVTFDSEIDAEMVNPSANYRNNEHPGKLLLAARANVTQPRVLPLIEPSSKRLVPCTADMSEWIEGDLAQHYLRKVDGEVMSALAEHHTMSPYFDENAHPATYTMFRHDPQRSLLWKARGNVLGTGDNLVKWGILSADAKEARCCCDWNDPEAPLESLDHLVFHCRLFVQEAGKMRGQSSMAAALGLVLENGITEVLLEKRKKRAHKCVQCLTQLWARRRQLRAQMFAEQE